MRNFEKQLYQKQNYENKHHNKIKSEISSGVWTFNETIYNNKKLN
jgi:hypothetical protein